MPIIRHVAIRPSAPVSRVRPGRRILRSDPDEPADQSWRATDVGRPPGS